ncbi:benzoate/H(+) symporter BenE family transporter [Paenibacillus agricola]|uniref:Benzoate transporter n=1 Tax=Paenibacillus agricola TaxID=2716264 RepID=A0ABX0J7C4_9BACL|nr:benzoate/H(+) symporter BenE family transporter [Paenibacillus agricola]NHN31701.1 benzoate transporter [Paenibacillus agricola]
MALNTQTLNTQNVLAGVMSALMACTGGAIMLINCAHIAGLNRSELISWFFIVYVVGGCLNVALSIRYQIPFAGAHSITAVAFLSTLVAQFTWNEVAGSFMMAGLLIVVLGLTGWFGKILDFIPKALIDAMLAGLILNYVVQIVPTLKAAPLVGGMAILGFFIAPKISRSIPPLLGVLVLGVIGLLISTDFPAIVPAAFSLPQWVSPHFTVNGLISIAIPMAVLILSNDLAVALAALKKNGYQPPVDKTLVMSGVGTAFVGLFGGHAVNIGGMMTAICSSEEAGPKESRVGAAIISGGLVALFGLFAWKVISIIELLPVTFITLLSGFSLLSVLLNSLQSAFSDSAYRYSILFAFVMAISNLSFLGISSPVWSLLIGMVTMKVLREGKA